MPVLTIPYLATGPVSTLMIYRAHRFACVGIVRAAVLRTSSLRPSAENTNVKVHRELQQGPVHPLPGRTRRSLVRCQYIHADVVLAGGWGVIASSS